MSDDLTAEQLREFHRRLTVSKEGVQALLSQTVDDSKPVDLNLPIGRLTRIDAIQMQAMAQMNRQQVGNRLQQIDAALASFERGTFGICRKCKDSVELERLEILPESPFCVACQESFEGD